MTRPADPAPTGVLLADPPGPTSPGDPPPESAASGRRRFRRPGRRRVALVLLAVLALVAAGSGILVLHRRAHAAWNSVGPRSIAMPAGAVVRPQAYGALADGRHDDAPAIQKAITAAAGHATVVLTPGTYECGQPLSIPSGTTLTGLSAGTTLRFDWTDQSGGRSSGPYLANEDPQHGNHDIAIRNVAVVGGGGGLPSGASADYPKGLATGMRWYLVDRLTLSHVSVSRTPGDALTFWGISDVAVTDSVVDHSGRGGIDIHWSNDGPNARILVAHNAFTFLGDDAVAVNGSNLRSANTTGALPTDIVVADNRIQSWTADPNGKIQGHGIALFGVTDAAVVDNAITSIAESGVIVRGGAMPGAVNPQTGQPWISSNVLIRGNTITDIGQDALHSPARSRTYFHSDGVEVNGGRSVTATGNTIRHVVDEPVHAEGCTACVMGPNGG